MRMLQQLNISLLLTMARTAQPQSLRVHKDSVTLEPLIISVKEARKILGKDAHQLSDDQIQELILQFTSMANEFLQN